MNDLYFAVKTKKACKDENHPGKPCNFNEIQTSLDEIFGLRLQMKLNPPLSPSVSVISSLQRFHPRSGFISTQADLTEKDSRLYPILSLFLVQKVG